MINPREIIKTVKNNFKLKGMIVVGANKCKELWVYRRSGLNPIILFEPLPDQYETLLKKSNKVLIHNLAVSNFNGEANFYVASNSVSSSLMKPKEVVHDQKINVIEEITVKVVTLDNFIDNKNEINLLVIDAEGSEMNILKGAEKMLLENIDVLSVELNYKENYEGLTYAEEVKEYINNLGFVMIKEVFGDQTKAYTDALYIKTNLR